MTFKIEKYCSCGGRLIKKVETEEEARQVIRDFNRSHTGREQDLIHQPMNAGAYWGKLHRDRKEANQRATQIQRSLTENAPNVRKYTVKRKPHGRR